MIDPSKPFRTNRRLLRAIKNFSAFVALLVGGTAAMYGAYVLLRGAAYAARDGNSVPLLILIGASLVMFIVWLLYGSTKRAAAGR